MREIKFRAWDLETETMHIVCNIEIYNNDDELWNKWEVFYEWFDTSRYFWNNKDYEQCKIIQYTWLKDKNWVEIYEGDIIQYKTYSKNTLWFAVVWYSNSWCWYILQNKELQVIWNLWKWNIPNLLYCWEYEIIWNIYENPELLQSN